MARRKTVINNRMTPLMKRPHMAPIRQKTAHFLNLLNLCHTTDSLNIVMKGRHKILKTAQSFQLWPLEPLAQGVKEA